MHAVVAKLNAEGLISDAEVLEFRGIEKAGRNVRKGEVSRIRKLVARYEALTREYATRFPEAPSRTTDPEPLSIADSTASAPVNSAFGRGTSVERYVADSRTMRPDMPLYPPSGDGQNPWGSAAEAEPRPLYGQRVGDAKPLKSTQDALVRTLLLAPVLGGQFSPSECAEFWQRLFRGTDLTAAEELYLTGIPVEARIKYRKINKRTLNYWLEKIREENSSAKLGGLSQRSVVDTLRHEYPAGSTRRRKRTPELEEKICELFKDHPDWNAVNVADHLRLTMKMVISDNFVRKIIREELIAKDRMEARGGPAAEDVAMRTRLLRESPYPNHTWLIDHSFIKQEMVDIESVGKVTDSFDFEFEFAVEAVTTHGQVIRRPAKGLWMTLVMDAYSRRRLCVRVWDHAPNTATTLLAIRDAALKFGLPAILYSDNGADFRSHEILSALHRAGIHQVFSLPYSPEGRGKIEVDFRNIKQKILSHMIGYHGGNHPVRYDLDDLMTLPQVEEQL